MYDTATICVNEVENTVFKNCTLFITSTANSITFDSCVLEYVNIVFSSNTGYISFISSVLKKVEIELEELDISTSTVLNSTFKGNGDFNTVQFWHSNILDSNFIGFNSIETHNITLEQ